jgi:hypothetical protein
MAMQLWKPLVLIIPAGLVLGMIGGHLARPVMQERAGEPWQSIFLTRSQQYGTTNYPTQGQGPTPYVGGYSYPPETIDLYHAYDETVPTYADAPLPSVDSLDARQAELLADPAVEFATSPPANEIEQGTEDTSAPAAQMAVGSTDAAPEPPSPDGSLPAIW